MQAPEIRLLSTNESLAVFASMARMHTEEIGQGFLTSLGTPLLERLYRAIETCPQAFILVASAEGHLIGFLCASLNTRDVYRHVIIRSWPYLFSAGVARLFAWRTLSRCWETLRYPARSTGHSLPNAEILNFCVTRRLQRAGIGMKLFKAMECEYRRRGIHQIKIVTGHAQSQAIRFYEKLGAEAVGRIEVHARVESHLFRYEIRNGVVDSQ